MSRLRNARRRVRMALIWSMGGAGAAWAGNPPATELGPAPIGVTIFAGRVSALAASPTDANRYYAAGADGGVFRSLDGGQSWTPLTDDQPTTAIGALVLDPADENIVYAGTGEANFANHSRYGLGLLRSLDGGDHWELLAGETFAGRTFAALAVHPQRPGVLFAALAPAGGFPALAAAKGHPGRQGPLGVFRSEDRGETWTHLTQGLPAATATGLAWDPADPQVLYAAIGDIFGGPDNGVYKSVDGGASWTRLGNGLPADPLRIGRISVAVAPTDPQTVYALITRFATPSGGAANMRGLFVSHDAGASWTRLTLENIQATYGWYLSVIAPHPTQDGLVFAGGLSLFRTLDGGGAWAEVTPPHVDIHALVWDAAGRALCGNDGGIHRSSNNGNSWAALNRTLGTIQFYAGLSTHPGDPSVLLGGTQDNGSNLRTAGEPGWISVLGGDGGWTQIDPQNPQRLFVELQGTGNLYRSTNGGATVSLIGGTLSGRNCFLPPYVLDSQNPQVMYYGTERVFRSLNGGGTWAAHSPDLTLGEGAIRALAIAPSDPGVLYAATNDGNVLVSRDGGAQFELRLSGVPGWPRVTRELFVHPADAGTVYLAVAAFGQAQVRRSRDYGATWSDLDAGLPDLPVNVVTADVRFEPPVLYAGSDAGVYRSIDDGRHWVRWGMDLPRTCVIDLRLEPDRGRLVVGTQGRGAWSVPITAPADLDLDGDVDTDDLTLILGTFGCAAEWPACAGDVDGDGVVDLDDLLRALAALSGS